MAGHSQHGSSSVNDTCSGDHPGFVRLVIFLSLKDRKDITLTIESYLKGSSDKPLVIHGVSGSGKTSVMAAAAYYLRERNAVKRMSVIVRFLGTTPHSSSIRHTLQSICEQVQTCN